MSTQRTAQELADDICRGVSELPDRSSPEDWPEAMLVTQDELHCIVLAALASQAEPKTDDIALPELPEYTKFGEYYNGHDILGFEGEQLEEFARAAVIADRQRRTRPATAQAEPTMSDAIAAGDGTLHGAIDYWQQRALKAEQSEDSRRIDAWASNPAWRLNLWAGKWSISTPDSVLTDWLGSPREAIDAAIAAKEQQS